MRTLRLIIEYEGTDFSGWQIQSQGERTIQGEMELAFFKIMGEKVRVIGASRTDSGVHACHQIANTRILSDMPARQIPLALNAHLPKSISVLSADDQPDDFSARVAARGKIYTYRILNRRSRAGLDRFRWCHVPVLLDREAMHRAIPYFVGEHDFKSFQASGCAAKTTVRHVYKMVMREEGRDRLLIDVFATAFLKQMVRNMVGTLLEVGHGRMKPDDIPRVFAARKRTAAGPTALAKGLTLVKIFTEEDPPPPDLLALVPLSRR